MPARVSNPVVAAPITPCIGVCRLDRDGYCRGCGRNGEEIARWRDLDDDARRRWIREVQPTRLPRP